MIRSPKLTYCELLLCYGFVRSVMPQEVIDFLYKNKPRALMIGSRDQQKNKSSFFRKESPEKYIMRHLKNLRCYFCEQPPREVAWVHPVWNSCDSLTSINGGRLGIVREAGRMRSEIME